MPPTPTPPTPAQLAGARRELARRPPAILADLEAGRLPGAVERAARRVEDLYPAVAAAVGPRLVLLAAAQESPAGHCRTCPLRLAARVHRQRLQLTPTARALLGPACPACRAVLDPKPKPKRPAQRAALSRVQRAEREVAGLRRVVAAALDELAAAAPGPGPGTITPATAAYNRQAVKRLGLDPRKAAHLTTATARARARGRR
jgi:hypothetical protein